MNWRFQRQPAIVATERARSLNFVTDAPPVIATIPDSSVTYSIPGDVTTASQALWLTFGTVGAAAFLVIMSAGITAILPVLGAGCMLVGSAWAWLRNDRRKLIYDALEFTLDGWAVKKRGQVVQSGDWAEYNGYAVIKTQSHVDLELRGVDGGVLCKVPLSSPNYAFPALTELIEVLNVRTPRDGIRLVESPNRDVMRRETAGFRIFGWLSLLGGAGLLALTGVWLLGALLAILGCFVLVALWQQDRYVTQCEKLLADNPRPEFTTFAAQPPNTQITRLGSAGIGRAVLIGIALGSIGEPSPAFMLPLALLAVLLPSRTRPRHVMILHDKWLVIDGRGTSEFDPITTSIQGHRGWFTKGIGTVELIDGNRRVKITNYRVGNRTLLGELQASQARAKIDSPQPMPN